MYSWLIRIERTRHKLQLVNSKTLVLIGRQNTYRSYNSMIKMMWKLILHILQVLRSQISVWEELEIMFILLLHLLEPLSLAKVWIQSRATETFSLGSTTIHLPKSQWQSLKTLEVKFKNQWNRHKGGSSTFNKECNQCQEKGQLKRELQFLVRDKDRHLMINPLLRLLHPWWCTSQWLSLQILGQWYRQAQDHH